MRLPHAPKSGFGQFNHPIIMDEGAPMAPSLVPAPSPIDRLVLDAGLDFIFHKDGMIELTEAGFRRMGQAHSAGLDTVIEVDQRYLLHYPASKPKFAGPDPVKEARGPK